MFLMATPSRFELPISSLTGRRVRPLHHGAIAKHLQFCTAEPSEITKLRIPSQQMTEAVKWSDSLTVVASNAVVTDLNLAIRSHHHRRDLVSTGESLNFSPVLGLQADVDLVVLKPFGS